VATGARGLGAATGPSVGPRLVPPGGAPWAPADTPRAAELRFVAVELIATAAVSGPAAGGAMEAAFQVPNDRVWRIERLAVSTTASQPTAAATYTGAASPENLVDYTPAGNGDIADETNPIVLPGGSVLRVRWTGANDGAVGTVHIQGWAGGLAQVAL
jgi:hypothetical protein